MNVKNDAGFTFIELLVVTTLIVVLTGLALVTLNDLKYQTYNNSTEAMQKDLIAAANLVRGDMDNAGEDLLFTATNSAITASTTTAGTYTGTDLSTVVSGLYNSDEIYWSMSVANGSSHNIVVNIAHCLSDVEDNYFQFEEDTTSVTRTVSSSAVAWGCNR